ncbi:MAG: hypothetical protein IM613_06790 [Cytophagales bacterium]|jgi:hypothetical protein|nr:hypothetical protein [Cytophagales bacterium]MCA6391770.1 hypothetical protein [Cytophagales bacterium]MCA6401870.1 hypothetical protein [Cytophagales bacterium]MCA6411775.1 hypothetical protein [Cytophagales bacterium]MCA6420408.1 hypothetical protein [Cytophagales bacterium]
MNVKNYVVVFSLMFFAEISFGQNTFPSSGNVGIGTASPGAKLSFSDLTGSAAADGITWYSPSPLDYGIFKTSGSWNAPNYQQLKLKWATGIVLDPGSSYGKSFVEIGGGGLRVTSGNVGIGTASPLSKLDVSASNFDLSILALRNSAWACNQRTAIEFWNGVNKNFATSRIVSKMDGCGAEGEALLFETQTAGATNPSVKLIIKNDGNVGIGTTSPSAKLNVYNSNNKTEVIIGNPSTATGGFTSLLMGTSADTNGFGYIEAVKSSGSAYGDVIISRWGGNVGIGTTTPLEKLHINGAIRGNQSGALRVNTGNGYVDVGPQNSGFSHFQTDRPSFYFNKPITIDGELTRYGGGNTVRIGSTTNGYVDVGPQNVSYCHFQTDRPEFYFNKPVSIQGRISSYGGDLQLAVNNSNQFTISQATGNVGIGITNPTQKLQVKGTVYSTEVKVDLAAGTGPDYVFEPTYDLKPLAEIETYIKENKHLPEVPSAKEMEKNGVQLGEMNMLLLKKVEELTLYVISQQNKIKEQELRIETLEKRFEK